MHIAKSLLIYLPNLTEHKLYTSIQITFPNQSWVHKEKQQTMMGQSFLLFLMNIIWVVEKSIYGLKPQLFMLTYKCKKFTCYGGIKMTLNWRIFITTVTALLFVILVLMNFLGFWTANPSIQILFFLIMVVSIFNAGIETSKILKNRG